MTQLKPQITYLNQQNYFESLQNTPAQSAEFIILVTGALSFSEPEEWQPVLQQCERVLKKGGVLFVQGLPHQLPTMGVFLEQFLTFKYWLSITAETLTTSKLPSVHAGVLLFMKGPGRFNIHASRLPHQHCTACGKTLKDWGGKAHLMHQDGYTISDVIKDLPVENQYTQISEPLFKLLLNMLDFPAKNEEKIALQGIVAPAEGLGWLPRTQEPPLSYTHQQLLAFPKTSANSINPSLRNIIHQGDALQILQQYPDNCFDLVFADPPYNLDKAYSTYNDGRADSFYLEWCNQWLAEYARVLKPTGSLMVLNLPRWGLHHAHFLQDKLFFQNWIVWDALSEPRGKVMPAHYALLFFTKHPTEFTFNYSAVSPLTSGQYCLRASCIKARKAAGDDVQLPLTDIWSDVHRIKHRRDRDYHPCQLPDGFMERIIKLTTNPGDVVLDIFGGVGTTALAAYRLGRDYVTMDIDPYYVNIMRQKMSEVEQKGVIERVSTKQPTRDVTKKELQLELQRLASELGRLPSQEDVQTQSPYQLQQFLDNFPTWGKALKAAKLEVNA